MLLTKVTTKLNSSAHQKPSTLNLFSSKILAANNTIRALITKINKPKVLILTQRLKPAKKGKTRLPS